MTLQDLMPALVHQLAEFPRADAVRDIRRLAAHVLEVSPDRMTLHMGDDVAADQEAQLHALIARRAAHEPVSKLIGQRAFWGRDFAVTPDVLDPRPETECLIEACLGAGPAVRVLDLGTGSGAIAVTLAAEWDAAAVTATDLSHAALDVARQNAVRHDVGERVEFVVSDWFDAVDGCYDLIVSNPPYIALAEMAGLAPEVRGHDPRMALTDEADGLTCYRIICYGAPAKMVSGGRLAVEIGPTQGDAVAQMMQAAGLVEIEIRPDLDGRNRVVLARNR